MGLFKTDEEYEVEFEYSDGFFRSYKKAYIVVKASSEWEAKDSAKKVLKAQHSYVTIKSAKKRGSSRSKNADIEKYNPEDYAHNESSVVNETSSDYKSENNNTVTPSSDNRGIRIFGIILLIVIVIMSILVIRTCVKVAREDGLFQPYQTVETFLTRC